MIDIQYLTEPKLQFAEGFEYEDSKSGIAEFGPFGRSVPGLHPDGIKLGFVGTADAIAGAREWIEALRHPIQSENFGVSKSETPDHPLLGIAGDKQEVIRFRKILNRDFIGFSKNSNWHCDLLLNARWERQLRAQDVDAVLQIGSKAERIRQLLDVLEGEVRSLAQTPPLPTVIVVALTEAMEELADTVPIAQGFHLNLRRALKARAMQWGVPIQIVRRKTVIGKKAQLQEPATRAWNLCTGLYYKADGVPWRPLGIPVDTCFIGIGFFAVADKSGERKMRASVAQAFDHLGQGVVLRGDPFEWDDETQGKAPHMTTGVARELARRTLGEYVRVRGNPPRRVVVHKTSRYWGQEHPESNEQAGLREGIEAVFSRCDIDLVALRQTGTRFFREGRYPPLRGTYLCVANQAHFLYTMGYIPYLETCPSSYVPEPWEIVHHIGGSSPKDILREALALTKINVNNCSYADSTPITLAFAQKVGEVMRHMPEGQSVESGYKFYM